jgi:hypothetical protein
MVAELCPKVEVEITASPEPQVIHYCQREQDGAVTLVPQIAETMKQDLTNRVWCRNKELV